MDVKISDGRLVLVTRATPTVLAFLPQLEGRRIWLKGGGLSLENTAHNREAITRQFGATIPDQRPQFIYRVPERPMPAFKRQPDPHQLEALEAIAEKSVFALFMEQGCVDKDTEYLSPSGWNKISEYEGGKVAQWNLDGSAEFVDPIGYLVKPCDEMYYYKTKYGCDQMVSPDHRLLLIEEKKPTRATKFGGWCDFVHQMNDGKWLIETTPRKFEERHSARIKKGENRNRFPCTFIIDGPGIDLTDDRIRLQVAFIADGSYGSSKIDVPAKSWRKGAIRIKKDRKKQRLRILLENAKVEYTETEIEGDFSIFKFIPPRAEKHFVSKDWWNCSFDQKKIIAEECIHWDGSGKSFFSTRDEDLDFIQFCFSSTGVRSRITKQVNRTPENGHSDLGSVHWTDEPVCFKFEEKVPTKDGLMYCFSVPSSYLVFRRNGCIFISGNTGKTKVGIDWAAKLFSSGQIDAVLVISKRGVHRQWILEELDKDCSVPFDGAFWNKKPIPPRLLRKSNQHFLWYAINWDALKTASGFTAAEAFVAAHKGRVLIIGDESQEIKNIKSQRAKAAFKLKAFSSHRMITTGTPIAKDLTDEWAQLSWLDENILRCKYITTFRAKYCIMGGWEGRSVIGQKNMDEFHEKATPYIFRRTKEQIGILPKRYAEWKFALTKEQKQIIQSIKLDALAELASGVTIELKTGMSAFSKLQQVACGFIIDSETQIAHRIMPVAKNPRVIAAMEWLQAGDGKAIIWSAFREDKLILAEALSAAGVTFVEYHGATSEADREATKRAFLDPSGAQVLVAGKSASTGLNLQGLCNRSLYYSNTFNAIDRWQSEDRIHRIGTIGTCVFTDLIGVGSTDRYIKRNLLKKEGVARLSLGDVIAALDEGDDFDFDVGGESYDAI